MRNPRLRKLSTLSKVIYLRRGGAGILILTKAWLSKGPSEWFSVVRRQRSLAAADGGVFMLTFELPKAGHRNTADPKAVPQATNGLLQCVS